MKESVTPRQEKFCQEIVAGNTQSEAYRAAYNAKNMKASTVNNKAYRLMQKGEIRARVEELRQPVVQAIQKSRIEWLKEIESIEFYKVRNLLDEEGNLKPISLLTDAELAAIEGIELIPCFEGTGNDRVQVGYRNKPKLASKQHALELYGKASGYLQEKNQKPSPLEEFGAEALLTMRKELQARIAARKALKGQAE